MSIKLKMFISDILIEAVPVEYEGLTTCDEKQRYQEKLAGDLFQRHKGKIMMAGVMPVIYVDGVESKLNQFKMDYHEFN